MNSTNAYLKHGSMEGFRVKRKMYQNIHKNPSLVTGRRNVRDAQMIDDFKAMGDITPSSLY